MSAKLSTLDNGLSIITDHVPEMDSVALGVWCDVGTRYENLELNGIAHLVEHMMFKGTHQRTALDISSEIENVGGQMNAYTSRENTAYFIHLLKEDMPLALDVLADIIQNSIFPEDELEKERSVIIQEIGMSNDTPDDLVFDLYQETAYPKQALGAPILGTPDIIQDMPHVALSRYISEFYTPEKLVISAAGYVEHGEFVSKVEAAFSNMKASGNTKPAQTPKYQGGDNRLEKDLEQAHIVLGFQSIGRQSEKYEAALLLSTILGGGMSSRLFQEVREKRGLVYSVYSHQSTYRDDGQIEIYAGTDPNRLEELIPTICDEINKMRENCITEKELNRAKAQIRSGLLMSRESMLSRADRQAKYFFNFKELPDVSDTIKKIDRVATDDICKLADQVFSNPMTFAALGPLKKLESFDKIQKRFDYS